MFRFSMWMAGLIVSAMAIAPAAAADLSKIDRTIRKEPKYKAKPLYFLLWFGPEAKTRVWVVLDGKDVYIDQNGNGDLTEPGEKGQFRDLREILAGDGKTTIKLRLQEPFQDKLYCQAFIQGRYSQSVFIKPADRPQDAPIHHFDGPLCIGVGDDLPRLKLARGPEPAKLYPTIGTRSPTGHWTRVDQDTEVFSRSIHPWADVEFANKKPGQPPIKTRVALQYHWGQVIFIAPVPVPEGAGNKARITFSFPDWKGFSVKPTTCELPIVDPKPETTVAPPPKLLNPIKPPVDLSKIDRTIFRAPTYKHKPRYCLLLFGPQANTRVWLVLDGDVLYVDRTGRGDWIKADKQKLGNEYLRFTINEILGNDGKTRHTQLHVVVNPSEIFPGNYCFNHMGVKINGKHAEYTFQKESAATPQEAAIRHFNGPRQMNLRLYQLVRGGPPMDLNAIISTTYPTGEWVFMDVHRSEGIPKDIHPVVEIEFPTKRSGGPPIKLKVPLTQRC